MIYNIENAVLKQGSFVFGRKVQAIANSAINKSVLKEFWFGHTYRTSEIEISETDELIFTIGNAEKLSLDGCLYAINVEPSGVCITAVNEKSLINGFVTLLDRIKLVNSEKNPGLEIECCEIRENPLIKNRMVHFCVFPDTEIWELERFVRLCGALKYSHLVLEFWGMLKYDCLKELSWNHAFTKEQIRPIIKEANDMGIEVIPMFNHWGHASASRVKHGKHVVLDQNPSLQTLFSEDGWCWDINKQEVRDLLKKIRYELMELCGYGEYFHIGCDEAYNFVFNKKNTDMLCNFINGINDEITSTGRRLIIWGDMLLSKRDEFNPLNSYYANSPNKEFEEFMLSSLNKNIVIADWQYKSKEYPVETSLILQNAGFDVLLCPWDVGIKESDSCIDTVKKHDLYGMMHTTWHTLSSGTPHVVRNAIACWQNSCEGRYRTESAAVLRKVYFVGGDYEKSGWSKHEI